MNYRKIDFRVALEDCTGGKLRLLFFFLFHGFRSLFGEFGGTL